MAQVLASALIAQFGCPTLILQASARFTMLFQLCALVTLAFVCRAQPEYYAVCDAGSTGTRLYVFQVDIAAAAAKSIFVKKVKPGLSSYVEAPANAVPPLLKLLVEGSKAVPEELRRGMPLMIFGTAGMRLLPSDEQAKIWEAVTSGLKRETTFPFASDKLVARTISGSDEGLWAVYNANFLTGRMSHDLSSHGKHAPLGLMDLGGSSTQIAIPAATAAIKGSHFGAGALVHSYLGFGMTYIREQMRKHATDGSDAVCYMKGAPIDGKLEGSGAGSSCRDLIREMTMQQSRHCQASSVAEKPCLGDLAQAPDAVDAIKGKVDFYAVAGLTYVVDFIRWWLELHPSAALPAEAFLRAYPQPSLNELRAATDAVCAGDYKFVADRTADKQLQHPFTGADNAPYRCFQANYILVLLGDMYGFSQDSRSVSFLLDVNGEDLEWPLGALLHQRAQTSKTGQEL